MKEQETPDWWHSGIRPDEVMIKTAVRLYDEGWTMKEIGKYFNRSQSNISVWINKFAKELTEPVMSRKSKRNEKRMKRATRRIGTMAPENSHDESASATVGKASRKVGNPGEKELKARIARLERELEDTRLMRDFYDEMINIAERDFNIPIRKKGGARQ